MLKASNSGSEREVLFRLKAVPDKDNPRAFKRMADDAIKSQRAIDQSVTRGAENQRKALDRQAQDHAKAQATMERDRRKAEDGELKSLIRREQASKKRAEAEIRETKRREDAELKSLIRRERAAKKYYDSQIREERRLAQEQERAAARAQSARNRQIEGTKQVMEGAVKLGRAFAMSGLIGEESMQKVLDMLIKVQVASDGVRGGMDLVQGLGKTKIGSAVGRGAGRLIGNMGGYAAGGAVMAGAGKAAGMVGAAGVGGSALAVGSAGLAAAGGIGAAGYSAWHTLRGNSDPSSLYGRVASFEGDVGAGIYGATGIDVGMPLDAVGNKISNWWNGTKHFNRKGSYRGLYESKAKTTRIQSARQQLLSSLEQNEQQGAMRVNAQRAEQELQRDARRSELARRYRDNPDGEGIVNASLAEDARARLASARGFEQRANEQNQDNPYVASRVSETEITNSIKQQQEAYREMLDLKKEEVAIRQRANERDKDTVHETIRGLNEQIKLREEEAKAIESNRRAMLGKVDEATPMERAQAVAALERNDRGENLSKQDAALVAKYGTDKEKEKAENSRYSQLEASGDPLAKRINDRARAEAEKNAREQEKLDDSLQEQIEQYRALESSFKDFADAAIASVESLENKVREATRRLLERQQEAEQDEAARNNANAR